MDRRDSLSRAFRGSPAAPASVSPEVPMRTAQKAAVAAGDSMERKSQKAVRSGSAAGRGGGTDGGTREQA